VGLLPESQLKILKKDLVERLVDPVTLIMFTQEFECDYCTDARELTQELGSLSDKIKVEVLDLLKDKEKATEFGVDKVPAIVIKGPKGNHVNFFGIPAGYEFNTLMKDIVQLSRGQTDLSPETREALSKVKGPVHIKVFVTPTCPYCPGAVSLAHQFAMENSNIKSEMVEINEFPQLAIKYNVMGVPKTIINETIEILGMQPEEEFLRHVEAATRPPSPTYA
jgi:glutaredoxin-like protein